LPVSADRFIEQVRITGLKLRPETETADIVGCEPPQPKYSMNSDIYNMTIAAEPSGYESQAAQMRSAHH
jgi:hypothetical protein